MDFLSKCVRGLCRDSLLRLHHPDYFRPVGSVPFLFEFVSYGVDYPIGQQPEEKVCVRAVVLLVVDGPEVEVCFQLPIGGFYFPGKIVVFPSISVRLIFILLMF